MCPKFDEISKSFIFPMVYINSLKPVIVWESDSDDLKYNHFTKTVTSCQVVRPWTDYLATGNSFREMIIF